MIDWTPELEERIISGLELKSLRKLCAEDSTLPDRTTIIRHQNEDESFATRCVRAREEHAEFMDDKIFDVAQRVENGELDPKAGSVAISAYQWRASKLKSKKFGDKVQQELTGANGGPIQAAVTVEFVKPKAE